MATSHSLKCTAIAPRMSASSPPQRQGGLLASSERDSSYRWVVCALLFFATTINYMDRAALGVLKPTLLSDLSWSESDYGKVVSWFSLCYAIGYALSGRLIDKLGVKLGYALAVACWSLAAMGHGLVATFAGFALMRAALGLAEGGNFPAAIKAVGETFPTRQQALAVGLFNSGSNVGVIVALLAIPSLTIHFGWPTAFFVTGTAGLFWIALWWPIYRGGSRPLADPSEISPSLEQPQRSWSWSELLQYRQVWAFIVGMALCSPIWWFFLFWSAGFFNDRFGIKLEQIGWPLAAVYLAADVGSIAGGWLSGWLMGRGWSIDGARKTAMFVCALFAVPVAAAPHVTQAWIAVAVIALAAAANQGFSANLFTIVSDTAPRSATSSIVGLGGLAAGLVAVAFQRFTGYVLGEWPAGYELILAIAALTYLAALAIICLICPRLTPMEASSLTTEK
jgi:ACS family hexuronate transporter-like MFS transporter